MSSAPWWVAEDFWRKCATFVTAIMELALILLTFHSLATIQSGAGRVPAYSVVNHRINAERGYQVPVIGRKPTETEAERQLDCLTTSR